MIDSKLEKALIKKHQAGQKKYGAFSFITDGKDMNKETIEELIDAINYQTYKAIKEDYGEEVILNWSERYFNSVYKDYIKNSKFSTVTKTFVKLIDKLK